MKTSNRTTLQGATLTPLLACEIGKQMLKSPLTEFFLGNANMPKSNFKLSPKSTIDAFTGGVIVDSNVVQTAGVRESVDKIAIINCYGEEEIAYRYRTNEFRPGQHSYYRLRFPEIKNSSNQPTSYLVYSSLDVVKKFTQKASISDTYGPVSYARIQSNITLVEDSGDLTKNVLESGQLAIDPKRALLSNEYSYLRLGPNTETIFVSVAFCNVNLNVGTLDIYFPDFLLHFYSAYQMKTSVGERFFDESDMKARLEATRHKATRARVPSLSDMLKQLPDD